MAEGLDISEDEFCRMRLTDQNLILFRNVNEIRKLVKGYKFWYRLYSIISGFLIAGVAYLFTAGRN